MPQDPELKERIVEEYVECASDPIYFMKNYVHIQHQEKGRILFDLFDFQERSLEEIMRNRYNVILKARQMGISTLVAAYSLWMMLFNNDKKILIVSLKRDVAKNIVQKVKYAHDNLPVWMREEKTEDPKLALGLANGSKIFAESTSTDAGRSESLSMLIMDEAAFIEKASELWSAAKATLDVGNGRAIVLSCVTEDTHVFTENGLRKVGDFVDKNKTGSYKVDSYNILGRDKTRKGEWFKNNGKQKVKKIKSSYTELEGTLNHKVYACSDGEYGWTELRDVNEGDYIPIQYGSEVFGDDDKISIDYTNSSKIKNEFKPEYISKDIAYLFGLYISEGSVYEYRTDDGRLEGGNLTIAIEDDISWLFESLGLKYSERSDGTHYTISSKNLIELLEGVGFDLDNRSLDKKIPNKLLSLSKDKTKYLLRGIFDGDGHSLNTKGNIGFTSSSDELIDQVRMLLLNFGIITKKYTQTKKVLNGGKDYDGFHNKFNSSNHQLFIDKFNSKKFYEKIGFGLDRKQSNASLLKGSNFDRAVSHDVIPNSLRIVNKLYEYYDKGTWSLSKYHGIHLNGIVTGPEEDRPKNVSRKKVKWLYDLVKDDIPNDLKNKVEKIVDDNIRWVEVKDIEYDKKKTYDFSLPETDDFWCHSILYNGIIGHQTPKNVGSWFHKTWNNAITGSEKVDSNPEKWVGTGENEFHPIKLHWSLHPHRDAAWRKEQDRIMGPDKAAREFDCDFSSSGDNVIDMGILDWYEENTVEEPRERRLVQGSQDLWVWEDPKPNEQYVLSADVARGDGSDNSAFQILSVENIDQKMEYRGKIPPDMFANLIYAHASYYNDALVVIERDDLGYQVLQELINRRYKNILYTSNDLSLIDVKNPSEFGGGKMKPGLDTNRKTRPIVVNKLKEFMRKKHCNVRSSRLIEELRTFVWKDNGKPEHMKGFHDDTVMAMTFGLWVRDTAIKYQHKLTEMTKKTLGGISSGRGKGLYTPDQAQSDPYTIEEGGQKHDIRWLLD